MKLRLVRERQAWADLDAAVDYYETALSPRLCDVRVWNLAEPFPYLVFYRFDAATLYVLAVIDARRNIPGVFQNR